MNYIDITFLLLFLDYMEQLAKQNKQKILFYFLLFKKRCWLFLLNKFLV